jgi:galactose mutarotase-like enzyme
MQKMQFLFQINIKRAMRQYKGEHLNQDALYLENDVLKLAVLPGLGAKIASLVYKPLNFEVFFQPAKGKYDLPAYGNEFAAYDTSGSDEMFPTIDVCADVANPTTQWPDHGEIWALPWQCMFDSKGLYSRVQGVMHNYIFERHITLNGNEVNLAYRITNKDNGLLYGLWAFHGLVAVDEQTEILLPGVDKVINVHDSALLGDVDSLHSYPVNAARIDLSKIAPASTKKSEKYYVNGPLQEGNCSLLLNKKQLEYQLLFNPKKLPYLGVWINEGGFKNEYNVALEPCNGFYDTAEMAAKNGTLTPLKPGQSITFNLNIVLTPTAI